MSEKMLGELGAVKVIRNAFFERRLNNGRVLHHKIVRQNAKTAGTRI